MIGSQGQEQENPFIRYMVGPTRSPNRDEPFHMLMRKYGAAATLLLGLAVGVPALGFIVAPILRGESWGSPADVGTIGFPCAWALTWALLYGYAVRKKEIPDWLIDPVMFLQETLVLLFDLSAVGLLPAGISLMANGCNAILMQAPHWRLHVAFCALTVLFEFYVPIAEDLGWPTGTLPGRRKLRWTDLLFVRACFAGPVMGLVVSALLMQMNEQRRQVAAADSTVRAATVLAELLGRYDTESAACSLRAGKIVQCTESETPKNSRYKVASFPTLMESDDEEESEDVVDSVPKTPAGDQNTGFSLDPQLYVAFQQLIANLDAYRPHLPNWLLAPVEDEEQADDDPCSDSETTINAAASIQVTQQQASASTTLSVRGQSTSSVSQNSVLKMNAQADANALKSRPVSAVAIDFWCPCTGATPESRQRGATALVDAVHRIANETRGAVHSFTFGEALVSFGAAARVPNPEAAAARFMLLLREAIADAVDAEAQPRADGAESIPLAEMRFCAAAATASGLSHQAGTRQRVLACDAPLRWRLRGLLKYAVEVCGTSPPACDPDTVAKERAAAECLLVLDRRTMRQASNVSCSGAGILSITVGPRDKSGAVSEPPSGDAADDPTPTRPMTIAAFDLMDWRRDGGDGEWLYAMERTPADDLIDLEEKLVDAVSAAAIDVRDGKLSAAQVLEVFDKLRESKPGGALLLRPMVRRWLFAAKRQSSAIAYHC